MSRPPARDLDAALVSGEAVPLDLRVARAGSRLVAALIDLALQLALLAALSAVLLTLFSSRSNPELGTALILIAILVALLGYPVVCETVWRGRTVGKLVMGLRVVRDDGGPVRFRHALVRGLFGLLVEKPGLGLGIPALVSSMTSRRAKRLGDVVAGTLVLQERVPSSPTAVISMPPPLAGWAATLDLSALPPSLLLAARQCLARWPNLNPPARDGLAAATADRIAAHVSPPPPPGTPAWAYLMAVLAERRDRDRADERTGLRPAPAVLTPPPPPLPGTGSGGFAPPG